MITSLSVKKTFEEDIRDKKRTASGIHKQKGKRGYVGKMRTTIDLLKGKARREYMKSGEIKMSNVYKQLLPFEELTTYSPKQQKNILEEWRNRHTQKEILDGLKVDKNVYYNLCHELGIIKNKNNPINRVEDPNRMDNKISKGDILEWNEFSKLDRKTRFYALDEYYKTYSAKEIGNFWGKSQANVHQIRYQLKKYMESINEDTKIAKQQLAPTNSIDREADTNNEVIEKDSAYDLEMNEEEKLETRNEAARPALPGNITELSNEVNELKKIVQKQANLLSSMLEKGNYIDQRYEVDKNMEKNEDVNSDSMTFSLDSKKEGFLLHNDVERFISVLRRNPDIFKIKIELTRIE